MHRSVIALAARIGAFVVAAALPALAPAQTSSGTQVTGQFAAVDTVTVDRSIVGSFFEATFQCSGEPTCTGTYQVTYRNSGCTNSFSGSGPMTLSGFDLSKPGPITVTATFGGADVHDQFNADGTCSLKPDAPGDITLSMTGSWDGTTEGVLTTSIPTGTGGMAIGVLVFTAQRNVQPVFPMTVTTNITPTSATAVAQFQPRPEDVGKTESVFVFAHAPASQVQGAKRAQDPNGGPIRLQDGGDPCVLAQVDPSGKLVAASASTMGAAFTGVLTAQGQSVTLLNNVPTPGVAGATMFTGYGTDAQSMLSSGVYQGAVTVPGAVSCGTTLAAAVAPASPDALSGLWYNPSESGWGIYFAQRRNLLFAAWYTYDGSGKPKWYVAPSCSMPAGVTGTSGTCTGDLFEVVGPTFFGAPFDPTRVSANKAGTLQVAFADASRASMTYTVAGQARTVPIARQVFQTSAVPPAVDFTDLWYNPGESGWGMAMSHQFGIIFAAWFVYDASGAPVWYVAPSCTVSGNGCSGALYRTTGPAFGPTFDPAAVHAFQVGTLNVTFSDANHALLSYTVDGVTGAKTVTRQTF